MTKQQKEINKTKNRNEDPRKNKLSSRNEKIEDQRSKPT